MCASKCWAHHTTVHVEKNTIKLRPWIRRLYLKMTAELRSQCSSEGVTVIKVDPVTKKKTVSVPQLSKEFLACAAIYLCLT